MLRTRVGYAGGIQKNPTYSSLGDHTEAIEIDYDPEVVTYEQLLNIFWHSHNPGSRPWSRQYMSAIFYHNEEQKRLAMVTRDREAAEKGAKIYTEILPASKFYRAEDYHQKYYLRQRPALMKVLAALYPNDQDFVDSTAAARINGYIAGHGKYSTIESELLGLDLPEAQEIQLLDLLRPTIK